MKVITGNRVSISSVSESMSNGKPLVSEMKDHFNLFNVKVTLFGLYSNVSKLN